MQLIREELLNAVIPDVIAGFTYVPKMEDFNYDEGYSYTLQNGDGKFINIYELAHKCKEWAYELNFEIVERKFNVIVLNKELEEVYIVEMYGEPAFSQKRIFKACQWVFDNQSGGAVMR